MHDRNLEWTNIDGKNIKLIDMETNHLCNTLKYLNKNKYSYEQNIGVKKTKQFIKNIELEIRFRKLNRLSIESNNEELF